jgi:two-component system, chemotaxis family, protein-glutamate methylesterase/glutaminase
MLRSVAVCCGPRGVGAVLTGTLGDGASGLWALHECGGLTVVQDPNDAAFPEMPRTAMDRAKPDHVVGLRDMPALLHSLAHEPAGAPVPVPAGTRFEVGIARNGHSSMDTMDGLGRRSVLSCPDCGGVMWEIAEGDLLRYRCHVGHTYTSDLMSVMTDENVRRSLGVALRALEERLALARKLYNEASERGDRLLAQNWSTKAQEFEREMNVIRDSIVRVDEIAANFERATKVAAE